VQFEDSTGWNREGGGGVGAARRGRSCLESMQAAEVEERGGETRAEVGFLDDLLFQLS
jgi:hypothetical protein